VGVSICLTLVCQHEKGLVPPTLMNGAQLARRIRERRPDTRIIVCTGLNEATYQADLSEIKIQRTLLKPFLTSELAVAIREVLDAG
jgi:DNA-binding NarL/FixJ family response regulator